MFEKILILFFLSCCILLWLFTFGYVLILRLLVFMKPRRAQKQVDFPPIAVVIPTLNEKRRIINKLTNMELCDYPRDRIRTIVVDGGSTDGTVNLVRKQISKGKKIEILCLNGSRGKTDQVNHILTNSSEQIIVFTDSDSRLEPSCIRELVHTIIIAPETAMVGAAVKPESLLLEEQIHWLFLNFIWWLEGEILSCAGISGVCYAVNRKAFFPIALDAVAEDVHLGLNVSARGYRVRICPEAKAVELRVPHTPREFIQFRRRRGAGYINELARSPACLNPPLRWKLARFIRLQQFSWISWLSASALAASGLLLLTRYRAYPFLLTTVFLISAFLLTMILFTRSDDPFRVTAFVSGVFRYAVLTLISLLSLKKIPSKTGPLGGKEETYDNSPAV